LRMAREHYLDWLPIARPDDDAFRAFIYGNTNYSLVIEHILYLCHRGWLDYQSKTLMVKALLINAEVGRPRLEQVTITFYFSRGGGVFTTMSLDSLFLESWPSYLSVIVDVVWMIMLVSTTVRSIVRLVRARRARLREIQNPFRASLEFVIIILGWANVAGFLVQLILQRSVIDQFQEVNKSTGQDVPADFNVQGADLHNNASAMAALMAWLRFLIAEYHLVLMFRFFIAFYAQPRLGLVTSTLESSVVDILHFLIVLLPTFASFAISGCFLFGLRLEEFSTFTGSVGACFRILMEGEYDWPRLSEEHFFTAMTWTWTFVLLLVLVMINMVLAIVMDIYTERRRLSGESESVWETLVQIAQRARLSKQWVSTTQLTQGLSALGSRFTVDELQEQFPEMHETQLHGLTAACWRQQDTKFGLDMDDWAETMKLMMAIHLDVDRLAEGLEALRTIQHHSAPAKQRDQQLSWSDAAGGWLQELSRQMAVHNHLVLSLQWLLQQLHWQCQAVDALYGPKGAITHPPVDQLSDDSVSVL